MASIKKLKKQISYLAGEIISNCNLAMYFQGKEAYEPLCELVQKAAKEHNEFRNAATHCPKDVNTKKYYSDLKKQMSDKAEDIFKEISAICQKK